MRVAIGSVTVTVACVAAAATATKASERRERKSIMFGVLYPAYFGLIFGLTSLAWLSTKPANALVARSEIPAAFPVALIGLIGWWSGYKLGSSRYIAGMARRTGDLFARRGSLDIATSRIVAVYALATFARLVLLTKGTYGYLADPTELLVSASPVDQIAAIISGFAPLALLLLAINFFRRRHSTFTRILPLVIATAFEVTFTSFSGQKHSFFFMGISLLVAGVAVGRLSWPSLLVATVVGVVLIFPFTANYRELLRPGPGQHADSTQARSHFITAASETLSEAGQPLNYLNDALGSASNRLRSIDGVAVSVYKHRTELPYEQPSSLVGQALDLAVPRVLWPSKPVDNSTLNISRDYYGIPESIFTSSTLTVVGDAYRYGGQVVVFVGLLWLGILCRFVDVAFDPRRAALLLVPLVAAIPILQSGSLLVMTFGFVRTYVLLIPLLWFLEGRQRTILQSA